MIINYQIPNEKCIRNGEIEDLDTFILCSMLKNLELNNIKLTTALHKNTDFKNIE